MKRQTRIPPKIPYPCWLRGQSVTASGGKLLSKKTKPPTRFSEASLVRELENRGIGRPATFAAIVDTIMKREYVRVEKRFLVPTPLGEQVVACSPGLFPSLISSSPGQWRTLWTHCRGQGCVP